MKDAVEQRLRRVLQELEALRDLAAELEHEVVQLTHDLGVSWDRIGEAHDPPRSREATTKRYSHVKRRRNR